MLSYYKFIFCLLIGGVCFSQNKVKILGQVRDFKTNKPIGDYSFSIPNTDISFEINNATGKFELLVPSSTEKIILNKDGYNVLIKRINLKKTLTLGVLFLKPIEALNTTFSTLNLTEDDLNDESGEVNNIAGIFSASNDIYLNTVGFEFQGVFYSVRGLGSDQVTFLLNGVNQNRLYDDRPAWNNWGGVDGIYRTQEVTEPLGNAGKTFGRALGVKSLTTRASKYRGGTRISYASSDRSYQHKASASHAGNLPNDWYYVATASRRWGNAGYREGTFYDANSLMLSVEKFLGKENSVTMSFLYTPNKRGLASILTDEVIDLKGTKYNSNWGYQNGARRNSRIRDIDEPILLVTHTYENKKNITWQNTAFFQRGKIGFSRIDYNGGVNPDPAYYQNLPSYELSRNTVDFEDVYNAQQNFINGGQLDWRALYEANNEAAAKGDPNAYVLYEDRRDEQRVQLNSNIEYKLNKSWKLNGSVDFRNTVSNNYALILDQLGGNGYLDIASFTNVQNDLNNPNRIVGTGSEFKYNYDINSTNIAAFAEATRQSKKLDLSASVGVANSVHQREGFYDHESYDDSFGKSDKINLTAFQGKVDVVYKISGRNIIDFKSAYIQKSPSLRQIFPNARVSNTVLDNIDTENLFSNSLTYIYRGLNFNTKLTGYYNKQTNVTETGFYFAEGFGNSRDNSAFVQEVLSGIDKEYKGLEFGANYKATSSLNITGVIGFGDYRYANNPNMTLFADQIEESSNLGFVDGRKNLGTANIKNKKLSSGPQEAYSLTLSYNDPSYWRIRVSVNHFRNNYVDISPNRYTQNFLTEIDGTPIADVDNNILNSILAQEKLSNFTLVNLSGGKSWRLPKNKGYLSLFWNVQNVLGIDYRTGGFQSSRLANYTEQLAEFEREKPLFGTRYFVGNGRTYFAGLYYSF